MPNTPNSAVKFGSLTKSVLERMFVIPKISPQPIYAGISGRKMLPITAQARLMRLEYFLRTAVLLAFTSPTAGVSAAGAGAGGTYMPDTFNGANAWRSLKYAASLPAVEGPTIN